MAFNAVFKGQAQITSINIRGTGKENDKIVAIDVKLRGDLEAEALRPVLGLDPLSNALEAFWDDDDGNIVPEPRFPGIAEIVTWGVFFNHHIRFNRGLAAYGDVKKIKFTPRGNKLAETELTFSINEPSDDLINYLVSRIKEFIDCQIQGPADVGI